MIGKECFKNANKPPLTPTDFLFPIVLTILLWLLIILMIKWVTFAAYLNRLYVNSWGNPKNEIEIFNKWQKIKLSLVFLIDRQTYVKYDCENA